MTVEELVARLQGMPWDAKVTVRVPPPGDCDYDLDHIEQDGDDVVLVGD